MRLQKHSRFFFLLLTLAFSSFFYAEAAKSDLNIRGAEQEELRLLDPMRSALAGLLYLPRKIADLAFYGAGKTAETLSDKDFIEKVKDVLYLYERKLLWYPILGYASGFRTNYGAGLFYKDGGFRSHFRAAAHDSDYWSLSLKNSYNYDLGWATWKTSLLGVLENKNDRRFYGLGAHPKSDPRNTFIANHDYGTYTEDRRKIQWTTGLENPGGNYSFQYLGFLQRRDFKSHGHGSNDLEDILDVSRIPGFQKPVSQIYNELSFTWDTRKNQKRLSPGFRAEVYGGFANGLSSNESDLFRTGFDAAGFIPIVKPDRVIVPRLVFDAVENLDNTPIPFSEYPRHHTFRGLSTREIIRSERVSMVPSLEYQWPLSHMLSGHIFFDTLIVGSRVSEFSWHHGLWAAGAGIDLHYLEHELGRMEVAGGSEGIYFSVSIGKPLRSNHRADW
jgi:hypothetical protein